MKAFENGNAYQIVEATQDRSRLFVALMRRDAITVNVGFSPDAQVHLTPQEAALLISVLESGIQEVLVDQATRPVAG